MCCIGKLVGDKGYIGKELFQRLFVNGIQLITKLKSNMKGALMSVSDKLLLRKRAVYQCTKNTGYTAYSILNSSNSRYIILPKFDGIVQVINTFFQANNLTR